MQCGLTMFPTHDAIDSMSLGRAAEQRGFESLFFPEHTHIPTSRREPRPPLRWPVPVRYRRRVEPGGDVREIWTKDEVEYHVDRYAELAR